MLGSYKDIDKAINFCPLLLSTSKKPSTTLLGSLGSKSFGSTLTCTSFKPMLFNSFCKDSCTLSFFAKYSGVGSNVSCVATFSASGLAFFAFILSYCRSNFFFTFEFLYISKASLYCCSCIAFVFVNVSISELISFICSVALFISFSFVELFFTLSFCLFLSMFAFIAPSRFTKLLSKNLIVFNKRLGFCFAFSVSATCLPNIVCISSIVASESISVGDTSRLTFILSFLIFSASLGSKFFNDTGL